MKDGARVAGGDLCRRQKRRQSCGSPVATSVANATEATTEPGGENGRRECAHTLLKCGEAATDNSALRIPNYALKRSAKLQFNFKKGRGPVSGIAAKISGFAYAASCRAVSAQGPLLYHIAFSRRCQTECFGGAVNTLFRLFRRFFAFVGLILRKKPISRFAKRRDRCKMEFPDPGR